MSRTIEVDTKTFIRFWLVVAALFLVFTAVQQAATGLLIVGLAVFLAIAVAPLVKKVEKILGPDKKSLAAGLTVGGIVLVIGVALAVIGPVVVSETSRFVAQTPELIQNGSFSWEGIDNLGKVFGIESAHTEIINAVKNFSQDFLANFSGNFLSSVGAIGSFLTGLVLVIVLAILCLTQGPDIINTLGKKLDDKTGKASAVIKRTLSRMAGVISKYLSGQALVAVIDGVATWIMVFILSLIFQFSPGLAFPMALIAMLFYLIPMFGPIITAALVSVVLFFSSPVAGIIFLVVYIVYEQIENNVIAPKVQGNAMDLPSLIVLISITIGMYMFGLLGAIISIPIAGMVKVIIDEYPNFRALRENN